MSARRRRPLVRSRAHCFAQTGEAPRECDVCRSFVLRSVGVRSKEAALCARARC